MNKQMFSYKPDFQMDKLKIEEFFKNYSVKGDLYGGLKYMTELVIYA